MANLMMSAAGVRLVPLLVATAFGMLPRTIALATAAAAAASTGASDLPSLVREQGWVWLAIGLAALVIALAVIARIARSALARAGLGA
jgi:uncharacterized membrane protein YdjX (TVP38/TMEM64 family)